MAPAARVWRARGEGLELTAKGSEDLRGGNICHFVVGICFKERAVLVEEETGKEKVLSLQDNYRNKIVQKQLNN